MIRSKLAAPVVGVALLVSAAMPMVRAFAAGPAMPLATEQSAGQQVAPLVRSDSAESQHLTGATMSKADAATGTEATGDASGNRQGMARPT